MFRLIVIVFWNMFRIPYMVLRMRRMASHPDRYPMSVRYAFARHEIGCMNNAGRIHVEVTGTENLPGAGGYIMFPNHQGKYDAMAVMYAHSLPCSFVMDSAKSYAFFVREMVDLLGAKRLRLNDLRQGLEIIRELSADVREGKKYILFSEGGYTKNHNHVQEFKAGSFKAATKAQAPIVPVCLVDTYKPLNSMIIGPVTVQVHFLKPLYYEEYKGMKTVEVAMVVRQRIIDCMESHGISQN